MVGMDTRHKKPRQGIIIIIIILLSAVGHTNNNDLIEVSEF